MLVDNAGIGMRTVNPRFMSEPQPFWEVEPAGFRDLVEPRWSAVSSWPDRWCRSCSVMVAGGSSTSL